eukprot:304854-Rhodomonas_salina.1
MQRLQALTARAFHVQEQISQVGLKNLARNPRGRILMRDWRCVFHGNGAFHGLQELSCCRFMELT